MDFMDFRRGVTTLALGIGLLATTGCEELAAQLENTLEAEFDGITAEEQAWSAINAYSTYVDNQSVVPTNMPTGGNASYQGYGLLEVSSAGSGATGGTQLFGRAILNAAFTNTGGSIAGSVTDLYGFETDRFVALKTAIANEDAAAIQNLIPGQENTNGAFDVDVPSFTGTNFTAEFGGAVTLFNSDREIKVSGTGNGQFRGANGEAAAVVGDTDFSMRVTDNGKATGGVFTVVTAK